MIDQPLSELSNSGVARRERMHDELIAAMTTHHRRRRVRRRMLVAAMLLLPLLLGTIALLIPSAAPPAVPGFVDDSPRRPDTEPGEARRSLIQIVRTDPSVVDRYSVTSIPIVTRIDDQQLLQELIALGRPAGIVRMDGRAWLTADVTDDTQRSHDVDQLPASSSGCLPDRAERWHSVDARPCRPTLLAPMLQTQRA